jgi:hypothetical protein
VDSGLAGLDPSPNQRHIACHVSCRLILLAIEFFHSDFMQKNVRCSDTSGPPNGESFAATRAKPKVVSDLPNVSFPDSC